MKRFFLHKKCWDRAKVKELEREDMLLPQSASLTAPSEKEPDSSLSDSFAFCPLSQQADSFDYPLSPSDSSPRGRAKKTFLLRTVCKIEKAQTHGLI